MKPYPPKIMGGEQTHRLLDHLGLAPGQRHPRQQVCAKASAPSTRTAAKAPPARLRSRCAAGVSLTGASGRS